MEAQRDAFIHKLSDVKTSDIGRGTRIWQFCVVMDDVRIGCDCNVCAQVLIENGVTIGNRVTVKSGVQLWSGTIVEDDVFIGPGAAFTNDKVPRSRCYPDSFDKLLLQEGASVGANATVLGGVVVGHHALVGAGAVVTRDVPPYAKVLGNPARVSGWVCKCGKPLIFDADGYALCCNVDYQMIDDQVEAKNAS